MVLPNKFCGTNPSVDNGSFPYVTPQAQISYGQTIHNGSFPGYNPNSYFTSGPGVNTQSRFYGPDALLAVAIWKGVCGPDFTTQAAVSAVFSNGSIPILQNTIPYSTPVNPTVPVISPVIPTPDTGTGVCYQPANFWRTDGLAGVTINPTNGTGYAGNNFSVPYNVPNAPPGTAAPFNATWQQWGIPNSYFLGPDGKTISNNESLAYNHLYLVQAYKTLFFADLGYQPTQPVLQGGYNEVSFVSLEVTGEVLEE